MAADYPLYLESGPRRRKTMVHVLDLLGCIATGPTTDAALDATPNAIRMYLRFLARSGEPVDPGPPFTTHIEQHITEGTWLGNGSPYVMFDPDFVPLTGADLAKLTNRLTCLREELAAWAEAASPEALSATHVGSTRTPRDILLHVLSAAGSYASPLVGGIPGNARLITATQRGDLPLAEGLRRSMALITQALLATTEEQRAAVVQHGQITRSLHNAIRRTLEHDWEHLAELSRRPGGPPA